MLIIIGLFEKDSTVLPISPSGIAGACTDELDSRFTGLDESIQDRIIRDYQVEDDTFSGYLERCRLDQWHSSILGQAKQDFAEEIAGETEDGKNMNDAKYELEELEANIAQKEKGKADGLLRSKHRY
jgi:nuclear pore complex protein Nup133